MCYNYLFASELQYKFCEKVFQEVSKFVFTNYDIFYTVKKPQLSTHLHIAQHMLLFCYFLIT